MKPIEPTNPLLAPTRRGVALGALLALATCAPPPPPPPAPTVVNVKASGSLTMNQLAGIGSPVSMRIYQLASKEAFNGADFFRLYNADVATLGADLIKKDEFVLVPGLSKSLRLTPAEPVKAIAVFAAYRDFGAVAWRVTVDVTQNKAVNLDIKADSQGITASASPAP